MSRQGKRWIACLRGIVLAILVGAQVATALAIAARKPHTTQFGQVDFNTYYAAAVLFTRGQDMYDGALTRELTTAQGLAYIENSNYIYPPYLAGLLSLAVSLEPLTLGLLWYLAGLAGLSLALWLILRGQSFCAKDAFRRWQYCLIFALVFAPVGHSFYVGQINAFLLLLFAAAFYALVREQSVCSGILLGAATLIKVAPGILSIPLLASRRYAAFWAMSLTAAGIPV
ncbi:MAG: DUF2029 domain-containing protein, partial [bacterium]|nr:DUF2029 domain-containing protein [bacterium]